MDRLSTAYKDIMLHEIASLLPVMTAPLPIGWQVRFALLFCLCCVIGCDDNPVSSTQSEWETATPESQGLDLELLDLRTADFERGRFGKIQSVLVARNGFLVYEKYFQGGSADRLNPLYSVTKGVTSALVGIAYDEGRIPDLSVKVLDLFAERGPFENVDSRKQSISLNDALQMRAGLIWDERSTAYGDPNNSATRLVQSDDWIKYALDQPMKHAPDSIFTFNSGLSILLSGAIQQATGQSAAAYAGAHLFAPLGITDYAWEVARNDLTDTAWGLALSARDLAKFGQLYLNKGRWGLTQVLSESWIARSTVPVSEFRDGTGYTDHWWLRPLPRFQSGYIVSVSGQGGQFLYIVPAYNLLIVITGETFGDVTTEPRLLFDFVMPLIEGLALSP